MSPAIALVVPWAAAAALALADGRRRVVGWLAVAALTATFALLCVLAGQVYDGGARQTVAGGWEPGVGIVLRADALGTLFAVLSIGVLLAALVHELLRGGQGRMFPSLVLFLATGLTGLFLTGDVFNFYVFFELTMLASYILAAYNGRGRELRAGFVFAVVNLLGSFLFLLGVAAVYHVTGTLEMAAVEDRLADVDPSAVVLIAVFFFVAFGVKLGLFPFHFWLPPVYASARPGVAAMLSGAVANVGSYGLLRFGADILPAELRLGAWVLLVLGTASILYGALQAVSRRSVGEVLAYSAIGQAGYVLIALGVGGAVGFAAAVIYAVVNSLNKTLLFLAIDVRGWLVGAAFVIGAFSVAGVPPSAGFFGKVALFQAGIEEGSVALVALIFVGGALSFLYMFQIYQHDYWRPGDEGRPPAERGPHSSVALRAVTLVVAALVVALGVWPEPLLVAAREAAAVVGAAP
ncbi:MAG TPA: proton-conducting transporter membrane subunit [Solirubrobacteraceae bacterium]|nr:proton-conducting transporter membrane subunit [Solirubrobacteraceae bacterium]